MEKATMEVVAEAVKTEPAKTDLDVVTKSYMMRTNWIGLAIIVGLGALLFFSDRYGMILTQKMGYQEVEIRLLQQELAELQRQGTYEQGFQDALVRTGRGTGTFADGYDAAVKVMGNQSYADGYHNAIKQFGYAIVSEEAKNSLAKYQEQQKAEIQNVGLKTK
mgnify:CR=1 FL=1